MARSVQATQERLISTAEALFAARGLDGVSLNEITKAAGQRNASALNYHFGGKDGLLDAILDKHQPALDAERRRMFEKLESTDDVTLRSLVEVLVLPLVAKLDDPDGGPEYIRVMAQLIGSPTHSFLDHLRVAALRRGNDGRSGQHRFEQNMGETLVTCVQSEAQSPSHVGGHFFSRSGTTELHAP